MSALSKAATCRRTQKLARRAQQNLRAPAVSPDIISCSSVFRASGEMQFADSLDSKLLCRLA